MRKRKNMRKVLVTDAQHRAALAIIRSLGRKKFKITAGSELKSAMGLYSKYCTEKVVYPNPKRDPLSFLKELLKLVKTKDFDCILPSHTYTMLLLCKYRDIFSRYTEIPPPSYDIFYNAYDKARLLKIAIKNGINCPETYFFNDLDEILSAISRYPVVVKPSKRHGVGIAICKTKSELKEKYSEMVSRYGDCIVQEYIPNGGEWGVYTLFDYNSKPVALTVQKRRRTLHHYGGASTFRETIRNERLVKIAFDLLKKLKWSGVAMVEFRIDARDGIPKLMEINPRFWGSLQLSISSGVDFPHLLYRLTTDKKIVPNLYFREGVQCRWLAGDIVGFFHSSEKLNFIKDFLKLRTKYDVLSLSDPKPFIISVIRPIKGSGDEEPREDDPTINIKELMK